MKPFLAAVLVVAAAAVAAVLAGDSLPPDASTGILRFARHHTGENGGKSVLMLQEEKHDGLAFFVDMTIAPIPTRAVLTFSAGGPKQQKVSINGSYVEFRIPKSDASVEGELTATLQIDSRPPYVFDTVVVGTKELWTGQSNAAMTEMLMNGGTGTPLLDALMAHPHCANVYFFHAITVPPTTALAPGSAATPQLDLPLAPTHGWINCNTHGFFNAIKGVGVLDGFSESGLAFAMETAELHQWSKPVMIYQTSAISTTLAPWSSSEMIAEAGVQSYITTPRNALNTASSLYNGQLAPLAPYAFAAIGRRQGESNAVENKTEFGMLLPVWHMHMAALLRDKKQIIMETELPPFVGSAAIPFRFDYLRDDQRKVTAVRRNSYLIPTGDLHDERGRVAGDNGTHNVNTYDIGFRNAQQLGASWFGMDLEVEPAEMSSARIRFTGPDTSRFVQITVKFSGVRSTGLKVLNTPRCETYPGCATAKSPIEVSYGHKWVSVTDVFDPARDYEYISGDTFEYKFAVPGRALFDGVRLTTSPYALKFLGDGDPAYPVRTFVYMMSAPSQ